MSLQKLVFNTTNKTARVFSATMPSEILFDFTNVSTIKPVDGYYEVIQKTENENSPTGHSAIPVLRVPIVNTNMVIEK
jgi:hypothetical protein